MNRPRSNRVLLIALAVAACCSLALPALPAPSTTAEPPIPGARTCFWYHGPTSGDPYINIAYPDSGAFYWSAVFTMPAGSRLELKGDFAYARYQSFISYDSDGKPVESLPDYLVDPQPGSVNPFRPGADRLAKNRAYSVEIIGGAPDPKRVEGEIVAGGSRSTLHAPGFTDGQQTLVYRVYASNDGRSLVGGVAFPEPVLTLANGTRLVGEAACAQLKTRQPPKLGLAALGIPVAQYLELTHLPGKPDTWPATNPPNWHIQSNRDNLIAIYTGNFTDGARRSEGGFYPNPDNNYVRTVINRRLGHVFVLRGKMPVTPKTLHNTATATEGELRYWSVCSNQSFANTRVNGCLFDEQVPVDANGMYTIIVSTRADRPRNARPECGLAWLPIADDGDGVSDKDIAIIQIRNMLASPSFANAIQRATGDADLASVMGPYLPKTFYTMPNTVEAQFPCPLPAR